MANELTITTYLKEGIPQGARRVFKDNSPYSLWLIPRASLEIIKGRNEFNTPAFYILLGKDEDKDENKKMDAYLGETDNFAVRVKDHDYKKEFWEKALIFHSVNNNNGLTKVDVQYVEHLAIKLAKEVGAFDLKENKQIPKEPNLPEHKKSTNVDFFKEIMLLTAFVGCNIFVKREQKDKVIFFIKQRNFEVKGYYDNDGFTILKGGSINPNTKDFFLGKEKRNRLIEEITSKEGNKLVLISDKTFSSPSAASVFCTGGNTNGWTTWKNDKNQTLDEVIRKKLEG